MHQSLIIAGTIVVYVFGGGFTCGLLKPDNADDGFWCFVLWWLILPCIALFGGIGLLGWSGYKVAKFLRGFFS